MRSLTARRRRLDQVVAAWREHQDVDAAARRCQLTASTVRDYLEYARSIGELPECDQVGVYPWRRSGSVHPTRGREVIDTYVELGSVAATARQLGMTELSVQAHLRHRRGLAVPSPRHLVAEMTSLYDVYASTAKVGRELGLDARTVARTLRDAGIPLLPAGGRRHGQRPEIPYERNPRISPLFAPLDEIA